MITIVDYGVGNLFSLQSSLDAIGAESQISGDADTLRASEKLLLPGVGAFADAAKKLRESGLADIVCEEALSGKPLLGVCLGMQLLFEKSYEYGEHNGLGLIPGCVRPISDVIPKNLKIPHIGWNALHFPNNLPKNDLFRYIDEGDCVYFVHSYYAAECEKNIIATAEYGAELTAAVASGNILGCQFHPEKSGGVGLSILRAFCEWGNQK